MGIQAVALDIDGTLLTSRDELTPAVAAAVRAVAERGVAVILATGRWYGSAKRYAGRLGATAPIISHSGARVTRQQPEEDLLHLTIPLEPAREIVALLDERGTLVNITVGDLTLTRPRAGLDPTRAPADLRVEALHLPFITAPPTSALIFDGAGIDDLVARFAPRFGDVIAFSVNRTSGSPDHLTLHHPAVDKGTALLRALQEIGVPPEETLAIGDAASDVAMFALAGTSVAMGNARPETQARATLTAPTNDEDGVAWALATLIG